ncbi:hypothetical protein SAMN02745866_00292 [Alteromonadaceae bacterium Bs31]|nr:hypothetical protein SAMN02745866_00292 [Alteromonadaceae bacterium Bs31]
MLLAGCARGPSVIPQLVDHYRLQEQLITGDNFDHKLYLNPAAESSYIHVYVGGDGVPWRYRVFVSSDPTPNNSLALHLLGDDKTASIFLGRPCYYGLYNSHNCNADLWTSARYSERVVGSMVQALSTLLQDQPDKKVILFGFSGGGTLVTLMAPRLQNVVAIVTVAGNLNTRMWTKHHHYLPMKESLNPFEMDSFPRHIRQFHIIGGQDSNVINEITQSYVDKHGGEIWVYPGYSHNCCWHDVWPGILQGVHKRLQQGQH